MDKAIFKSSQHRRAIAIGCYYEYHRYLYASLSFYYAGYYGLIYLFIVPELVFYALLSVFTLLHHTAPDNCFLSASEWSPQAARVSKSIHVQYPLLLDWMTHYIAWHVPHHICPRYPFTISGKRTLQLRIVPHLVNKKVFSIEYLISVHLQCQLIESWNPGGQGWISTRTNNRSSQMEVIKQLNDKSD